MQTVPKRNRPRPTLDRLTGEQLDTYLAERGWLFCKCHQQWGYCPTYTKGSLVLFLWNGKLLDTSELYRCLVADWVPYGYDELDYKLNRMRSEFSEIGLPRRNS